MITYLKDKENDLTTYASIKKIHEVNNHRGEHKLISAYSNLDLPFFLNISHSYTTSIIKRAVSRFIFPAYLKVYLIFLTPL